VHSGDDIARIAAVARALDRPAVIVSNGAVGWHLFAAMIRAAEAEDTALAFVFDAADSAGTAAEALRSGAKLVLSEAPAAQFASLLALAEATGGQLLESLAQAPLDSPDVETIKRCLCGASSPTTGQ